MSDRPVAFDNPKDEVGSFAPYDGKKPPKDTRGIMNESTNQGVEVGDIVELKSGGPKMTVTALLVPATGSGARKADCSWSDGATIQTQTFPVASLRSA